MDASTDVQNNTTADSCFVLSDIEYWYCEGCDQYFSDKDGTKEIKKADTVTAKLPQTPQTGDTSNLALWIALLFISGGAVIAATVIVIRKKKHNR